MDSRASDLAFDHRTFAQDLVRSQHTYYAIELAVAYATLNLSAALQDNYDQGQSIFGDRASWMHAQGEGNSFYKLCLKRLRSLLACLHTLSAAVLCCS